MTRLFLILYAEALATGVAAIFVTPLAIVQAWMGHWAGLHNYARCACYGGAAITLASFASVIL